MDKTFYPYSAHPFARKKSILYSPALCIKKICTENTEATNLGKLTNAFLKRGFREKLLKRQCDQVRKIERSIIITQRIPFLLTFNLKKKITYS